MRYNNITKMLQKNELKILKTLCKDFTRVLTITDIAKELKQKYVQSHRTIYKLEKAKVISLKKVGKSKVVKLNLQESHQEYNIAENERTAELCKKNINIALTKKNIQEINKNLICILFGSQTKKQKPKSDIDLLFVLPEEYNMESYEREIKKGLIARNTDIGESSETIPAHISGSALDLSFNHRYLTTALSLTTTESISLLAAGVGRPLIIKGVGDTSLLYLVSPMNQ